MTSSIQEVDTGGPRPLYQYSNVLKVTSGVDLLVLSGQLAVDEAGDLVGVGDVEAQARQVYRNISAILESASASLADIFKYTIFLTRLEDGPAFMKVRSEVFADVYPPDTAPPTSTLIYVNGLVAPEYLIEIEATAVLPP